MLLCLLLLWAVLRCSLSFFVVLPSFSFFFGWGCFLPLFCWKVLPYLLFLWVVFLGWTTFPFSSVGWCRLASLFGCCCVWPSLLLRGAAFLLPLLVVLLSLSSSLGWCCLASFVERCCVVPSPFAWCRLPSPPSLGGARFSPLFCWVVLSTFSSFRWGCFLLVGAAFLLLLWVGLLSLSSSLGWCCLASFVGWCCVIPSLFCVVLPSFPSFLGWGSFKKKNQKIGKNQVKNKK